MDTLPFVWLVFLDRENGEVGRDDNLEFRELGREDEGEDGKSKLGFDWASGSGDRKNGESLPAGLLVGVVGNASLPSL